MTMRTHVVLLFVAAAVLLASADNPYTSKYDNIDVDRILSNDRVLTNYIKCVMDEGPCTSDGRELKKLLPDALASDCTKCNEKQKTTAEKVFKHLTKNRPKDWDRLSKKFDPQGTYKKRYEEHISKS